MSWTNRKKIGEHEGQISTLQNKVAELYDRVINLNKREEISMSSLETIAETMALAAKRIEEIEKTQEEMIHAGANGERNTNKNFTYLLEAIQVLHPGYKINITKLEDSEP